MKPSLGVLFLLVVVAMADSAACILPRVPANHFPKGTLADSTLRIFGDAAVLMGNAGMQVEQKSEIIRMTTLLMTTLFRKHGESWQVIAIYVSKAQA